MNPFRRISGSVGRPPSATRHPCLGRLRLGRGPIFDAMAIAARGAHLGLGEVVSDCRGEAAPMLEASSLHTAAARVVDLLLQHAAATGCDKAHLASWYGDRRFDARLVSVPTATNATKTDAVLAELDDWARAFGGDVRMYASDRGAVWLSVGLADGEDDVEPELESPADLDAWTPLPLPTGRFFGSETT